MLPKDEIKLERNKTTAIFRIFQEALTNIARHSEASKVTVSLLNHQSIIYLEIEDNGKGISQDQVKDFKSLGIHGMQERAMVFGGQVYIEGITGKGTMVRVEIPFDEIKND